MMTEYIAMCDSISLGKSNLSETISPGKAEKRLDWM